MAERPAAKSCGRLVDQARRPCRSTPTAAKRRCLARIWRKLEANACAREPPLRGELYGAARLAQHAVGVAAGHRAILLRRPTRLLARLDENEKILRAFNRASKSISRQQARQLTPAAEWLLDNGYLIEEQIHMARRHLPRGYSS